MSPPPFGSSGQVTGPENVSNVPLSADRNRINISIDELIIPENRRPSDPEAVRAIAQSFEAMGQKTPISVCLDSSRPGKFILIAGHKRVLAAELIGWTGIMAVVEEYSETARTLWEIDENYARQELTAQERAEADACRMKLLASFSGQVVPKNGRGRPRGGLSDAARTLPMPGRSESAKRKQLERSAKIASISEAAKKRARDHGLDDNQTALLVIAREEGTEAQLAKVEELASRAADRGCNPAAVLPLIESPPLHPGAGKTFDLMVITPGPDDIRRLGNNYADEGALERMLTPALRQLAKTAVIVALAPVADIPVVTGRLLGPVCGFPKRPRIFRLRCPANREITEEPVLIVAARGGANLHFSSETEMLGSENSEAVLEIATKMSPSATNKAWLFADAVQAGWTCAAVADTWVGDR